MSVIHKKSNGGASTEIEKEVREVKAAGEQTAALLALSFKAEVEAARAETEESIISSIRNNLVSLPEQGEEWNEKKSYITGDVVTLDGP